MGVLGSLCMFGETHLNALCCLRCCCLVYFSITRLKGSLTVRNHKQVLMVKAVTTNFRIHGINTWACFASVPSAAHTVAGNSNLGDKYTYLLISLDSIVTRSVSMFTLIDRK